MYPWLTVYWQSWLAAFSEGRLAHAWLISGPSGLGKLALAEEMARAVLCQQPGAEGACGFCHACELMAHGNHPDLQRIGQGDEKSIGVDTIRGVITQLNSSAQLSGGKVVILTRADAMTEAAENALLKTLEEPAGRSMLVLLSDQPNRLLPTILSRCQKIAIRTPEAHSLLGWLQQQEGGEQASQLHLRLNQFAPLQTLAYLRDGLEAKRQALLCAVLQAIEHPSQSGSLVTQIAANTPHSYHWIHYLLLDTLKAQSGCGSEQWTMSDASACITSLAKFSTGHLLQALSLLQPLMSPVEGMVTSIPSLHITQWCHFLITEEPELAR